MHVGGRTVFVGPAQMQQEADVPETAYTLRSASSSQTNDHAGLSVRKLVVLAGADPDSVGFVSVKRPDGTLAYLAGADIADPPPFPEGPALVWVDGDTSRFFRPVRNDSDVNAADNVGTESGQPLVVDVHAGPLIGVSATARPAKAAAGADIAFSANASGGRDLSYTWTFDDGTHAHGQTVTHAYKLAGGYNAFVTVAGAGDSGGSSPTIHVVIGNPPKGPAPRAGGGSTKRKAPGGGSTSTDSTSKPSSPSAPAPRSTSGPANPALRAGALAATPAKPVPHPRSNLPVINGELLAYSQPLKTAAAPGSIAGARAGTSQDGAGLPVTGIAAAFLIALGAAGESRGRRRFAR